jgi:hypothetical protein
MQLGLFSISYGGGVENLDECARPYLRWVRANVGESRHSRSE